MSGPHLWRNNARLIEKNLEWKTLWVKPLGIPNRWENQAGNVVKRLSSARAAENRQEWRQIVARQNTILGLRGHRSK